MLKTFLLLCALLMLFAATGSSAQEDPRLNTCQYSIMLAQKAYLSGTPDAQRPDVDHLEYLVDYWGDQMIVPHDREVAKRAVYYMAMRVKGAGIRRPFYALMDEPTGEALNTECGKYVAK